jgi:hypothetical protein
MAMKENATETVRPAELPRTSLTIYSLTDTVVALTTLAHCTMQVDKMRSLATLIGVSSFGWEQNSNNLHEIHAIDYINDTIDEPYKIHYFALDYIHISKHQNLDVSSSADPVPPLYSSDSENTAANKPFSHYGDMSSTFLGSEEQTQQQEDDNMDAATGQQESAADTASRDDDQSVAVLTRRLRCLFGVITWSCLLMLCCLMEMAVELFITGIFRLYGALSSC